MFHSSPWPSASSRLGIAALLCALVAACSSPPDPRRTNFKVEGEGVKVEYDDKTGRLKRIDVDQDKNGRIDTFGYWDATRLIGIEIDADEDGRIERWEHYGDGNKLQSVGTSSKGDGVEDTWSYPDAAGLLLKVEIDTDRDGTIDKRDIYAAAPDAPDSRVLATVELGLDKTGTPARRLHYRPDGTFDRTETVRP